MKNVFMLISTFKNDRSEIHIRGWAKNINWSLFIYFCFGVSAIARAIVDHCPSTPYWLH